MNLPSYRKYLRLAAGAAAASGAGYLVAMKAGALAVRPERLAAVALLAWLLVAATVAGAVVAVVRGPRRWSAAGEALALAGVLVVLAAGLANWALGVQGYVLLFEREPVRLDRPDARASLFLGPLADRGNLALTIALGRLNFVPAGPGQFGVQSRLRVLSADGEEVGLDVATGHPAAHRALVFRQGMFGFAPRLVVTEGDRVVFDGFVPFRTRLGRGEAIAFAGEWKGPGDGLSLRGAVTLDALDDYMKGHPRLELEASLAGEPLGRGDLAPGERVALGRDYQVAFLGLQRWSEIDLARKTFAGWMIAGLAMTLLGGTLWAFAAWRRR